MPLFTEEPFGGLAGRRMLKLTHRSASPRLLQGVSGLQALAALVCRGPRQALGLPCLRDRGHVLGKPIPPDQETGKGPGRWALSPVPCP